MAVDFGILAQAPSIGRSFMAGREAAQAEQERNMLRQQQAEQMQFQRENMLAQREIQRENMLAQREQRLAAASEREAAAQERAARVARQRDADEYLARVADVFAQNNMPLTPETAQQGLAFALRSGDKNAVEMMSKTVQAMQEKASYEQERQRLGLGAPGAAVGREQVQNMLMSSNPQIVAQGKALAGTLEKPQTYTPSADMQGYELAKQEGFKGTFFDYKRQLAEAGRPPAQPREPAPRTTKVELADGTIGVMDLATGEVTPAKVGGQAAKGKPSAFAEKSAAQRKQLGLDLDRAIVELTDATKSGGLIDQSTGSGAGRLVDVGAGFFGRATPGAIAAGKLAPIADLVLKMVPRFEGPQSDKDTKSYKEAAGQLADSTLPTAIRKQAGLEIVRLMKARKDQFVTPDMAAEGAAAPAGAPATTKSGATVSNW